MKLVFTRIIALISLIILFFVILINNPFELFILKSRANHIVPSISKYESPISKESNVTFELLSEHAYYKGARDILLSQDGIPSIDIPLKSIGDGQIIHVEYQDDWDPGNQKKDTVYQWGGKFINYVIKDEKNRLVLIHYSHLNTFPSRNSGYIKAGERVQKGEIIGYSGHSGNAGKYIGTPQAKYGYQVHIGFNLIEKLPQDIQKRIYRAIISGNDYRTDSNYAPGSKDDDPGRFLDNILNNKPANLAGIFDH